VSAVTCAELLWIGEGTGVCRVASQMFRSAWDKRPKISQA